MNDGDQIINHFGLRGQPFVVDDNEFYTTTFQVVFEPIKSKTSQPVFVCDDDTGYIIRVHKFIETTPLEIQSRSDISQNVIYDDSTCIRPLPQKILLMGKIVFLIA